MAHYIQLHIMPASCNFTSRRLPVPQPLCFGAKGLQGQSGGDGQAETNDGRQAGDVEGGTAAAVAAATSGGGGILTVTVLTLAVAVAVATAVVVAVRGGGAVEALLVLDDVRLGVLVLALVGREGLGGGGQADVGALSGRSTSARNEG